VQRETTSRTYLKGVTLQVNLGLASLQLTTPLHRVKGFALKRLVQRRARYDAGVFDGGRGVDW